MTSSGWIMLVMSWGAIIGLAAFCFFVMKKGGKL